MGDKYTIWVDPNCFACKVTEKSFKAKKLSYEINDLTKKENEVALTSAYPKFKKNKSTPVIQKCTIENDGKITNCTFTQGFRESDYE